MTISMYATSIPVFRKTLNSLSAILGKAAAHAEARKFEEPALLQARLFPDMLALTRQVQLVSDFAKRGAARLAGIEAPPYEDNEQTFADLQARLAKTVAFIDSVTAVQIDGSEELALVIPIGPGKTMDMKGQDYLLHYLLPNLFFHTATAYNILRHNGVEIGKKDFLGAA
jgi:hypothetical protein